LLGIPVTNLSVNLARSTGPALLVGGWALEQLWLFWVAPIFGAVLAGITYRVFEAEEVLPAPATTRAIQEPHRVTCRREVDKVPNAAALVITLRKCLQFARLFVFARVPGARAVNGPFRAHGWRG
jgi:Major intrinsic protein